MTAIDPRTTIDRSPMAPFQITAVLICMALNLIDGFDVLAVAFAAPLLAKDWQLPPDALGMLMSAGLAGMTAGSILIAPLADRYGRRMLTLLSLVLVSVGMLAAALTASASQLALARVVTGLGVGAMLPSINTIVAEYASAERRGLALSVMSVGYPIGATLGGTAAIFIAARFGWRGIFAAGGALSTLLIPLAWRGLPESLDFLLTKRPAGALAAANALLRRLGHAALDALPERVGTRSEARTSDLVAGGLARTTMLLWTAFFCVMFVFYFVLSWTPKLLVDAGMTTGKGLSGGVLLNLGGIVGIVSLGALTLKFGLLRLHTLMLVGSAVTIACFGLASGSLGAALGLAPVVGFFLFTAMVGLYMVLPSVYPTEVRNTGTGLAIGVGRLGGVLSPYLAGVLLTAGWSPNTTYLVFGAPMLLSAAAIALLARKRVPAHVAVAV